MIRISLILIIFQIMVPSLYAYDQLDNLNPRTKLQNYINDHPNAGCPTNSSCSKQMGTLRQAWIEHLSSRKESESSQETKLSFHQFQKRLGSPIYVWLIPKVQKPLDQNAKNSYQFITWNSSCRQHRRDEENPRPIIHLAKTFVSNINEIQREYDNFAIVFNRAYIERNKEIIKFNLPTKELPIKIKNDELFFLFEEEGHYYSIAINQKGDLSFLPPKQTDHFPKNTECTKELEARFQEDLEIENLYANSFCRKIWNEDKKNFETMIFGWTCI